MAEMRFFKGGDGVWINPAHIVRIYTHNTDYYAIMTDGRRPQIAAKDAERLLPNERGQRKKKSAET